MRQTIPFISTLIAAFFGVVACGGSDLDPDDPPTPSCGDGVLADGEVCDGLVFGGETCVTLGYDSGELACADDCGAFDTEDCVMESCGNGVLDDGEVCDGDELGGRDCVDLGYHGGDLACAADCAAFDESGCELCEAPLIRGDGAPLAARNECGTLSYGLYANQGQEEVVHRLPDFSFAGYRQGGVAIPEVATAVTVEPGPGDDRERIQSAIDEVSELPLSPEGHRGAVELAAGTYEVGDSLIIGASGVVLRGSGQGDGGTLLVATRREQHDLIMVQGEGSGLGEVPDTRVDITAALVPVGSHQVEVASTEPFAEGDLVALVRTPNQRWLDDLGMDVWGWTTGSYTIGFERRVVTVDEESLTLDLPVVDTVEDQYGGGVLYRADLSDRIEEVGVEDLRLISEYSHETDEDHGWRGVILRRATNSWVRRVTVVHFGYAAVSLNSQSSFNTVEECAMLAPISQVTGGRRYSFNLTDGTGNLFQRCYSEEARHDFVSGARTTGPNVWLDGYSHDSSNDDGPHHRWATGLLFDNLASRWLHVENRQDSGTGHGWSGAQTLFWNGLTEGVRCDAPLGAMNWAIGCTGEEQEGGWAPEEPFGWFESHGSPVEPRSLYLQQLHDRLGAEAVRAVTTAGQRNGRIWGQLATWAGQGRLDEFTATGGDPRCATGLVSGLTCCPAACGDCGGSGCSSRPGGAEACCTGHIQTSGRSCQVFEPPCLLDPSFEPIAAP